MWCRTVSRSTLERIISVASCNTAMSRMLDWISRKGRPQGELGLYDFLRLPLLGESRVATDGMLSSDFSRQEGKYGAAGRQCHPGSERVHDAQRDYVA